MSSAHATEQKIVNPGSLRASNALTGMWVACIVIGLIAFFTGYSSDPVRAWASILRSHFYFMGIAVGALFFTAIHWITTSMWSSVVRRVGESFTAYLPFVLASSVLVFMGAHSIFAWTHPESFKGDEVLEGKLGYLNLTFFAIRTLIAVCGWIFFATKLVKASLKADNGVPNYKEMFVKNRVLSVIFVLFFAITFSMVAFDQLMSVDPHFFSTMFGVYTFAGIYQTFYAALGIVVILLKRAGYLDKLVNENHIHDIAKLMFAFTIFWAYTGFSQYMLYWYANLPEETGWFILRFNPGWEFYTISLFVGKFFIPFFLLLPRGNKRCEELVFLTACWILVMQFMDLNWMIQPQFSEAGPRIGFTEIGVWLGFFGVFGFMVTAFLKKNNVVAIKDPYLADSAFHHHQ